MEPFCRTQEQCRALYLRQENPLKMALVYCRLQIYCRILIVIRKYEFSIGYPVGDSGKHIMFHLAKFILTSVNKIQREI